jgi:hypothetical protein
MGCWAELVEESKTGMSPQKRATISFDDERMTPLRTLKDRREAAADRLRKQAKGAAASAGAHSSAHVALPDLS